MKFALKNRAFVFFVFVFFFVFFCKVIVGYKNENLRSNRGLKN